MAFLERQRKEIFFPALKRLDRLWSLPNLLISVGGIFLKDKAAGT